MTYLILLGLLLTIGWLLRANYTAEKRFRCMRYCWTKLAENHLDANGSEEWPEVAAAELKPYIDLMRRFGITPLTPVAMTLYEEALAERNIEPLD